MSFVKVDIKQPIYSTDEGDTVVVYNRHIEDAIKCKGLLSVKSPHGHKTFDPRWVKKNCPIIEKVFLRFEQPMKLYKLFIPKQTSEQQAKENYLISQGLI